MRTFFLSLVFIAACFQAFAAVNYHGSIMRQGLPLYPIQDGVVSDFAVSGVTFNFKAVTFGTKTWVWTKLNGKSLDDSNWSSRLRLGYPDKQESNLLNRVPGTPQTYGVTGMPNINPCQSLISRNVKLTFLQGENNVFYETSEIDYDYMRANSADASDQTKPVLNNMIVSATSQQLHFSLSASDNSESFFYYIEDAINKIAEVSFFDEVNLNLVPGRAYYFSIYAVDFSGNYSDPASYSTTFTGLSAIEANVVSVYPNPSDNVLNIKGIDAPVAVRILDMAGKTVLSRVLSSEKEIDISGLSRGVYFLKIKTQTIKFIKK
ncbi:MAG: T9SS type A sorting domain-containing protein [Dysgonamonadaceae bacterium]|jgi:hypothetical protein|nr:T9SS type A sorting domain-containing protein [Dysgonamonadaceae bacterium]